MKHFESDFRERTPKAVPEAEPTLDRLKGRVNAGLVRGPGPLYKPGLRSPPGIRHLLQMPDPFTRLQWGENVATGRERKQGAKNGQWER
jgi:hypothetical protein